MTNLNEKEVNSTVSNQPRIYHQDNQLTIINGDCLEALKTLPAESVQMCVTSPPYY